MTTGSATFDRKNSCPTDISSMHGKKRSLSTADSVTDVSSAKYCVRQMSFGQMFMTKSCGTIMENVKRCHNIVSVKCWLVKCFSTEKYGAMLENSTL
jgi:hypothetical protein